MKFFKITVFSFFALAACGSLRAQDFTGRVRDAENQPLVGASVYWAGTTIRSQHRRPGVRSSFTA